MRQAIVPLLSAGDMVGSLTSKGEDLNQIIMASIQAIYTGAPVGSLKLQISNDNVPLGSLGLDPAANVVNWTDYTGSAAAVSAAGSYMWLLADIGYRWVRVVYTVTSGTGALTINYCGKGV